MRNSSFQFPIILYFVEFCCFFCILFNAESVDGECVNGFEVACEWLHDDKSALRWNFKTDEDGSNIVELKDCQYPKCGVGVITTAWLEPRDREEWISINYKIYGTSDVYLRIYLRTADGGSGQHQIFSQAGNYAYQFPKKWTEKDVLIPVVSSKHRLLIKAHIPFKEAYVAVKDIVLRGNTLITSTSSESSNMEREDKLSTEFESTEHQPYINTEINNTEIFINTSSELSLSGKYWNSALSSTQAFDFLNFPLLPSPLQQTMKYLSMILIVLFMKLMRVN